MSRRASLPGADELFRRTERYPEPRKSTSRQEAKSANLQVAEPSQAAPDQTPAPPRRRPKHDQKVTFYCTREDLMALERTRLELRSGHGVAADRGRIVRAALSYVLEDFEARGEDSVLLDRLRGESH